MGDDTMSVVMVVLRERGSWCRCRRRSRCVGWGEVEAEKRDDIFRFK